VRLQQGHASDIAQVHSHWIVDEVEGNVGLGYGLLLLDLGQFNLSGFRHHIQQQGGALLLV
jgi:hypothetical protein